MYSHPQMYGSTAGPFGGMGGCAMTTMQVFVFIPRGRDENIFVYVNGRHLYDLPYNREFVEDAILRRNVPDKPTKYLTFDKI